MVISSTFLFSATKSLSHQFPSSKMSSFVFPEAEVFRAQRERVGFGWQGIEGRAGFESRLCPSPAVWL